MKNKFKKITIRRLLNAFRVYISYSASVLFNNTIRPAFPISLTVEPAAGCNLSCPQCPAGTGDLRRDEGNMDFELFKKITDETAPYILSMLLYFQGEPYMTPVFFQCVEYAALEKNIYTISSTNAHFLNEVNAHKTIKSGLDELIISLDGITDDSYTSYRRGGNLSLVLKNTERFMEIRNTYKSKTPRVVIQMLALKTNIAERNDVKAFAKRVGADAFEIKTAQFYDFAEGNELMPETSRFSRYKKGKDGKSRLKGKLRNRCRRLWETSVITWEGDVLPCCFDKDARHVFGNVQRQSLRSINNCPAARDFRKTVLKNRSSIEICRNCTQR